MTTTQDRIVEAIESLTAQMNEAPQLGDICAALDLGRSRVSGLLGALVASGRVSRIGARGHSRYAVGTVYVTVDGGMGSRAPEVFRVRSKPFKGLRWRVLRAAVFADVEPRIDDVAVRAVPPMNAPAEVALRRSMVAVDSYPARAG